VADEAQLDAVIASATEALGVPSVLVHARREFVLDLVNDVATFRIIGESGLFGEGVQRFLETGAALSHDVTRAFFIAGDDPLSARSVVRQNYVVDQPGLEARIETESSAPATRHILALPGGSTSMRMARNSRREASMSESRAT
jgi:hypothetical protein